MTTFSDDHPIDILRGYEVPSPADVRRELEVRLQWLRHRIYLRAIDGRKADSEIRELAALVVARDTYCEKWPAPVSDTDRPAAGDEE